MTVSVYCLFLYIFNARANPFVMFGYVLILYVLLYSSVLFGSLLIVLVDVVIVATYTCRRCWKK